MASMTVSEARAALPEIIERVLDGEEVTLTRHGRPVAVVVRPDLLRVRRTGGALDAASRVHDLLDRARGVPLPDQEGLSAARADELVAEVRAGRSAR
jgi:antitoxin (DNA-binding transcriptional repressor) of toxin-antitoxin stability system